MNKMMTMVFFFVKLLVPVPSWSPIPNLFAFLFVDAKKKNISVPTSQSIFPPLVSLDHRPQNVPEIKECQPTKAKVKSLQKFVSHPLHEDKSNCEEDEPHLVQILLSQTRPFLKFSS